MTIGIPKEIKTGGNRVALTPAGARVLTREEHVVLVEADAGAGSGLDDAQYEASGAKVVASAEEVWGQADMVLKVKEPVTNEVPFFREGLLLFTYPLSPWDFSFVMQDFSVKSVLGSSRKSKKRERHRQTNCFYFIIGQYPHVLRGGS